MHRLLELLQNPAGRSIRFADVVGGARPLSTPEARARWRLTHKLRRYGLTQEQFDQLLEEQDYACAMCLASFEDGQAVFIDHDHACCPDEKRSCGKCVRGLLCLRCNTGLGYIESMGDLARAYLDAQKPRRVRNSGASVLDVAV